MQSDLEKLVLQREIEHFFAREAELLDERRFDEWLETIAEDVRYFMPLARNFKYDEPTTEYTREGLDAALFDEGKRELRLRVKQIQGGDHWAEEPLSRTTHLTTNILLVNQDLETLTVKSRFAVYRKRLQSDVDMFIGKRLDVLRRSPDGLQLVHRTIHLDQATLMARSITVLL